MDFYSDFVKYYNDIFPPKMETANFINSYVRDDDSRILDLGCGTGSLLEFLKTVPGNITGIDLDEDMLNLARQKNPGMHFYMKDIVAISELHGKFDLIFSTGNVLSYLSPAKFTSTAKMIKHKLATTGKFVFQIVNWEKFGGGYNHQFPELVNKEKGLTFLRWYKHVTNKNEVEFQTELVKDGISVFRGNSRLFPTTKSDLEKILYLAGFTEVNIFGDFRKNSYSEDSPAIVVVCS